MIKYVWEVHKLKQGITAEIETFEYSYEKANEELRKIYPSAYKDLNLVYKGEVKKRFPLDTSKPIIRLWSGPSLKIFDDNIEFFRGLDVYYDALSMSHIYDKKILSKINKHSSFYYTDHPHLVDEFIDRAKVYDDIIAYCATRHKSWWRHCPETIFDRVFFFDDDLVGGVANVVFPSFYLGFKKMFMFGMDGGLVNGERYYLKEMYRLKDFPEKDSFCYGDMQSDIKYLNNLFWYEAKQKGLDIEVLNVCNESGIKSLQVISFEQFKNLIASS